MLSRPYENETMANSSEGDTVEPTNTNKSTTNGINLPVFREGARKRRRLESLTTNSEIPKKTQRRDEPGDSHAETPGEKKVDSAEDRKDSSLPRCRRRRDQALATDSSDARTAGTRVCGTGRDDAARLRKTIQWLEEGARRLREDLANVRTELHEERRAAKIAKRGFEAALREARLAEAAKYQPIIAELKTRIIHSASPSPSPSPLPSFKTDSAKGENHRRELSTLRKRLAEAESTIRRLEWQSVKSQASTTRSANGASSCGEVRRLKAEVGSLRAENEKLEEKLQIALNAEKTRIAEIRVQRENHEAELSALRKSLRSETIKMMDELRGKSREIEKLSKLSKRRNLTPIERDTMRKLRENEKSRPIRSASRVEKKILTENGHIAVGSCVREVESGRAVNEIEVERLRELALEQQEVIEILRQAVKEKERKLEQLSNKRRKEEFYRQWVELEPVAEVDDEEDHEGNDSTLSGSPSSMSPQLGGWDQWQVNGVSREAYEAVLVEIEKLQSRLLREQQKLSRDKIQICDLEKKCADRDKELSELNDKLRAAEKREAGLLAELSGVREQYELLEFRLLELEATPVRRDSPDDSMDSGIVSPELVHANKDHTNKQRNRAVATVIPYTNNATVTNSAKSASPVLPRKPPLTLQESGIFEEEYEEEDEEEVPGEIELASRGTQTQAPSGELLQEVQRLQELRARIQERAAKTTAPVFQPIDSPKICLDVDSIVQLTTYQERVRDLEVRLEVYEEAEKKREPEKQLSKQREEELLDENYRLTERIYWLENELRNVALQSNPGVDDVDSRDETAVAERSETVAEQRESEIFEDSGSPTGTRTRFTSCSAQTAETCVNNAIVECRRCRDHVSVGDSEQWIAPGARRNATSTFVSLEEREKEKDGEMELREPEEPVVVDFTESDSEKKVRRRRIKNNKREIRSARTARMTDVRLRPSADHEFPTEETMNPWVNPRHERGQYGWRCLVCPSDDQKWYVLRINEGACGSSAAPPEPATPHPG